VTLVSHSEERNMPAGNLGDLEQVAGSLGELEHVAVGELPVEELVGLVEQPLHAQQ
jgi:hypothetical protein